MEVPSDNFKLLLLDKSFQVVEVIDYYISFIWTDRYSKCGDFELYVPATVKMIEKFKMDYYLWLSESEHVMIIESIELISDFDEGDRLTIKGRSLESILERRVVWGQLKLAGDFASNIYALLMTQIVSPSISSRQISNFIYETTTDTRITSILFEAEYFGEDLYSIITQLCDTYKIGFKICLNDNNQFVFSLYKGTDRSYAQDQNPYVVFSPGFENLSNTNYLFDNTRYRNVSLTATSGDNNAKMYVEVSLDASVISDIERRETYTSTSISSDIDEETTTQDIINKLNTAGKESLSECTSEEVFEGNAEASKGFVYGEDFFIGDIVQIENSYGQQGPAYITELIIGHTIDEGLQIFPTFEMYKEGEET